MATPLPPGVELRARIGEGGLADVFAGTWRGEPAALKVLREPDRPGLRKRFLREGRLLLRLSHPGLVRCEAVLDGDPPVLVLELLGGDSLDRRLAKGPLPPEAVVELAASVLRTLAYLHEQGIVHRDLKSANLWLGDDGRVVVLDLGLAADVSDPLTTTLGDILGTHAYMAPEQIAGAETDHRVDLYSLGITLYEALCGQRPYQATGLAGFLQAHRAAGALPIAERVPGVPPRLATLIDRLMARDPAARPASAAVALALLTGAAGVRRALEAPRMLGREAARGAVQAVVDGGGVLRVTGELGSGLGTVAQLARTVARAAGVEHVTLRCWRKLAPDQAMAVLARELGAAVGRVAPTEAGVREALRVLGLQDGRVVVIVEDLDLAPPGVAERLASLAEAPGVALVVTGRSLGPLPAGRELPLRPLEPEEVRQLVAGMLGTATVPVGLDAALYRACGGLPGVLVAALREHVGRGAVWCEGVGEDGRPRWAWDPTAPLAPGADVTRLFEGALDALPEATGRVLRALVVAGEPVPIEILLAAAGVDASGLDLGPASRAGLVEVARFAGEEWVSIRRAVLEPALRQRIPEPEAAALHLALARAARGRGPEDWSERFARVQLARGARSPEETGRLLAYGDALVQAARPALGLAVIEVATLLPLEAGPALARLALARCDALVALGRLPEARLALEAGRAVAAACDDAPLVERGSLANVEIALALGARVPDDARARVLAPDPSARSAVCAGELALRGGDLAGASAAFEAALARALPGRDDAAGVAARLGLARIAGLRGNLDGAAERCHALAEALRATDRPVGACLALVEAAELETGAGRLAHAVSTLEAARRLARARAAPWLDAAIGVARARLHLAAHDLDGASALFAAHAACAEPAAPWPVRAAWLAGTAELRELQDDGPSALDAHLRAAEAAAVTPDAPRAAFHAGMVAILTADSDGVVAALDALTSYRTPGLAARLLFRGAVVGRDADILAAAEDEARAAGDSLLLLRVLHHRRAAVEEARAICSAALDGLHGGLAEELRAAPQVRWALGERAGGRRDTRD